MSAVTPCFLQLQLMLDLFTKLKWAPSAGIVLQVYKSEYLSVPQIQGTNQWQCSPNIEHWPHRSSTTQDIDHTGANIHYARHWPYWTYTTPGIDQTGHTPRQTLTTRDIHYARYRPNWNIPRHTLTTQDTISDIHHTRNPPNQLGPRAQLSFFRGGQLGPWGPICHEPDKEIDQVILFLCIQLFPKLVNQDTFDKAKYYDGKGC